MAGGGIGWLGLGRQAPREQALDQTQASQGVVRTEALAVLTGFAVPLGVFAATLSPTIDPGDSGQLVVAASELGIAHPPGYPLWCLVGYVFSRVLPFGELALRLNLLSALLGSVATAGMVVVLLRRRVGPLSAILGSLALALASTFWSQAIIAEVYTLAALVAVWTVWRLDEFDRSPTRRNAGFLALAGGLGIAAHTGLAVFVPVVAFALLRRSREQGGSLLVSAQLFWLGPLLYVVYLPLSARSTPRLLWADTSTVASWWSHVTRAEYGGYVWPGLGRVTSELGSFGVWLAGQVTLLGALLAGLSLLAWKGSRWLRRDVALFCLAGPISVLLLAGLLRGEQLHGIDVYYIPALVMTCLLLAEGLGVLSRFASPGRGRRVATAAVIALLVVSLASGAIKRWPEVSRRDNRVAYDYAKALLAPLPNGSVLYAQGDFEIFPLMYVQTADGYRQDVIVLDAAHPDGRNDVYGYAAPHEVRRAFATVELAGLPPGGRVRGLAVELDVQGIPDSSTPPLPLAHQPPRIAHLGRWDRALLARYHLSQARYAFSVGRADVAAQELERGRSLAHDSEKTLNNLATLAARNDLAGLAQSLWREALTISPDYTPARQNLEQLEAYLAQHRDRTVDGI